MSRGRSSRSRCAACCWARRASGGWPRWRSRGGISGRGAVPHTPNPRHPGRSEAESRDPGATAVHLPLGPGSAARYAVLRPG
ncbi:hypothetical protein DMC25_16365 [Caulobacter sp. D4A]|nr:hypothetical protein DMC25_16365 [Caulobacter sp. D4A]PXA96518.1 hypothetical protein DMC18_01210 [Caulobacter sp. D5]